MIKFVFNINVYLMAERMGFEPMKGKSFTRFPSVRLKPLGHLSIISFYRFLSNFIFNFTKVIILIINISLIHNL